MIAINTRKQYPSLDIAKFVMALLILTQHTSNEWAHSTGIVHALLGLGNFAVPFFLHVPDFCFSPNMTPYQKQDGQTIIKCGPYASVRCI